MNEEHELPRGWVLTTIGEVAETTSGGTPSRNHLEYYRGTIPWVKSGELEDTVLYDVEEFLTDDGLKNSSAKVFNKGTVLVAMYGATVGRTGILGLDATTNQAVCAIFPLENAFTSKFVAYWLQFQRQALIDQSVGGAQPNINQGIIRAFPLPLPPLPEQQRIVAAIEQQFSRLDEGVAALRRAQARLKRYRAAVLKAAVEGKLTGDWHAEHPATEPASRLLEHILAERRAKWEADLRAKGRDPAKVRYVEPARPDMDNLSELPDGWCWANLGTLANIQLGKMLSPKAYEPGLLQLPYLRNENVRWGSIDYSDVKMMGFKNGELEKYRLEPYDLLICEGGEAGRCAVYKDAPGQFMYQKALHRVRMEGRIVDPYFIQFCMQHYVTSKIVIPRPSETTIQHLPLEKIQVLPIPLPPLNEQQLIVSEVERRLSIVSELEATVEANLKRAGRLRQSILREAFAGRLVAQDPSDEPASVLLERIRSERREREEQKNGTAKNRRTVHVVARGPVEIDVKETRQGELWESVGGTRAE